MNETPTEKGRSTFRRGTDTERNGKRGAKKGDSKKKNRKTSRRKVGQAKIRETYSGATIWKETELTMSRISQVKKKNISRKGNQK